jgi:hypothetical protein
MLEGGLGPTGPVLTRWHLEFKADFFAWDHSDVRTAGRYSLRPDGTFVTGNPQGRYDSAHDRVLWEGQWYEREGESPQ